MTTAVQLRRSRSLSVDDGASDRTAPCDEQVRHAERSTLWTSDRRLDQFTASCSTPLAWQTCKSVPRSTSSVSIG